MDVVSRKLAQFVSDPFSTIEGSISLDEVGAELFYMAKNLIVLSISKRKQLDAQRSK